MKTMTKLIIGEALLIIPFGFILRYIFDSVLVSLLVGVSMIVGFFLTLENSR